MTRAQLEAGMGQGGDWQHPGGRSDPDTIPVRRVPPPQPPPPAGAPAVPPGRKPENHWVTALGLLVILACGAALSWYLHYDTGGTEYVPGPAATAPAAHAASHGAKAKAGPSPSCKLRTTFDYIERDDDPGASVQAIEIGNVDYSACADSLSTFRSEAGQGDGECTTIALASDNPGYDVNRVPAPPLRHVIESAGPGCG